VGETNPPLWIRACQYLNNDRGRLDMTLHSANGLVRKLSSEEGDFQIILWKNFKGKDF